MEAIDRGDMDPKYIFNDFNTLPDILYNDDERPKLYTIYDTSSEYLCDNPIYKTSWFIKLYTLKKYIKKYTIYSCINNE